MSTAMSIGAWRDRTNLFISYRQSYTHHPRSTAKRSNGARFFDHDSERAGLMSDLDSGDAVIEMDVLPPAWLDIQDEISQQLGEVASKMRRLEQLHAKHVLPGFDDESVKMKEEKEIEGLTQEITRGFSFCQARIKKIDAMLQSQSSPTQADETMARNLKISLATRVGEVSTLFRKKQTAYLKKLRSLGGMNPPIDRAGTPSLASNPYTDPAMMDEEADRSSAQSTLQQTQSQIRQRRGVHDAAIDQREREIEKIAQGVIDLSNIFQELNSMVIDQGSLLDRIDYNVERTLEDVKGAEKELKVATGYQKKSTKRKIILLLVLLVVGMFVLLIVKPKGRGGDSAPTSPAPAPPGEQLPPRWVGAHHSRRRVEWKERRRREGGLSMMVL